MKFLVNATIWNKETKHYWTLDIVLEAQNISDAIQKMDVAISMWNLYGIELRIEGVTSSSIPSKAQTILYFDGAVEANHTTFEAAGFKKFLLEAASAELIPGE